MSIVQVIILYWLYKITFAYCTHFLTITHDYSHRNSGTGPHIAAHKSESVPALHIVCPTFEYLFILCERMVFNYLISANLKISQIYGILKKEKEWHPPFWYFNFSSNEYQMIVLIIRPIRNLFYHSLIWYFTFFIFHVTLGLNRSLQNRVANKLTLDMDLDLMYLNY
jgi:hypothetical protein